jgi:hypothetical protein
MWTEVNWPQRVQKECEYICETSGYTNGGERFDYLSDYQFLNDSGTLS